MSIAPTKASETGVENGQKTRILPAIAICSGQRRCKSKKLPTDSVVSYLIPSTAAEGYGEFHGAKAVTYQVQRPFTS